MRILTDILIKQSPQWGKETEYLNKNNKLALKFPFKIKELLIPILETIQIIKRAKRFDVIVTGNIKAAQLFGLFRRIFRIDRPKHIVLELMLDEEQDTIFWRVKRNIQRAAFSKIDVIFVSSTHEIDIYSSRFTLPKGCVRFLPFHTNIIEPGIVEGTEDFILSAGRTGRDYTTLAAAVKDIDQKVVIVSDSESVKNITFSSNVEVLCNIPYSHYLDLLHRCRIIVVPLRKLVKSTGQVVVLEAMGLGKPVITTSTIGTVDYITDGTNGLLVPVEDPEALKSAILRLYNDIELYNKIASNALESVRENYTFDIYTSRILRTAYEIAGDDMVLKNNINNIRV
jgi:glycosyltransferase involved in cell wall biosynthesis